METKKLKEDSVFKKSLTELFNPDMVKSRPIISTRGEEHHHQCYFCNTIFPNDDMLHTHKKMLHSCTCDRCPRRFTARSELDRHHLHPEGTAVLSSPPSNSSKRSCLAFKENYSKENAKNSDDETELPLLKQRLENNPVKRHKESYNVVEEVVIFSSESESDEHNDETPKFKISGSNSSSLRPMPALISLSHSLKCKTENNTLQKFKESNSCMEDIITISSESDSDEDTRDEAPELKISSVNSGSDSSGFRHIPAPDLLETQILSFLPTQIPLPELQIKKEEDDELGSPSSITKSPFSSIQIEKEDIDNLLNIEPKTDIEEELGQSNDQEHHEIIKRMSPPPNLNQNQSYNTDTTMKCFQCGLPLHKSNFASTSQEELKCFQCQPQVFFQTPCPICEENVNNVEMQYHLEYAHHDVFVYPCKMCQIMIRKHDIIPHMKICNKSGGKAKVLCPFCNKDMLKTSLALHMLTHVNRPKLQCPHCESKVMNLKGHIKRKHSGI